MVITKIILLTLAIELITILGRIQFGSIQNHYNKIKFKFKIRIHHGYIGIALSLIYLIYPVQEYLIIGIALLISDAIHHFITLPIWVSRTEFP